MVFDNPGGGSFSLGPRDTRDSAAADRRARVSPRPKFAAGPVSIKIVVLADGLVVGGLTFVLDPKFHHPPREERRRSTKRRRTRSTKGKHEHHQDMGITSVRGDA